MRIHFAVFLTVFLTACAGAPKPVDRPTPPTNRAANSTLPHAIHPNSTLPSGALPDRVAYLQTDPRWSDHRLGNSRDTMGSDGCLVTAVAMAVSNLGYRLDPAQLNHRLTEANAFTPQGWLVWSGVEVATKGHAKATYYDTVSPSLIRKCMTAGDYPLVRFILPNGRSHWAMIVAQDAKGHYRMRDPLRASRSPLIFPRPASAFKSLRCVGAA